MKGKIITFEGLDCCFKETNAKRLHEYLTTIGIPCNIISFPRYDEEASIFVRRMLNGDYPNITNKQSAYLYALDRFDYINKNNVIKRLENGEWFIFDRYVESNVIYQASVTPDKNVINMMAKDIFNLEYNILKLPKPDIIIAMYSDFELVKQVLESKENKDAYEKDLDYLEIVFKCYDKMIDMYGWNKIYTYENDNFKSHNRIFKEIIDTIREKIRI